MAIKLTADSFVAGVRQSRLVPPDQLDAALRRYASAGFHTVDAETIARALVDGGAITQWQADKLLQGRFKGFILGRYKLQKLLGRGEMSSIYLAEHAMMKRTCAIKVLPANKVKDTSYLGRFHREAQAVASLDHPNIVRAYDVDKESEAGTDIHFLVMEYVDGVDLERLHSEQGDFDIITAADYIRQAAEGLSHAHENGLIHRDIKPGNLLVDKKGTVKLLDLGLARFFKDNEEESLTIKHDEKVLGTADYLAPEQAVDSHAVDERADIYSLGCTFYFSLVGHPPFIDGTLVQRLLAHQTKAPPPVRRQRPEIPESLARIVEKMMHKRKEDRYQTAREVADALGRWLIRNAGADWKRKHAEVVVALSDVADVDTTTTSTGANSGVNAKSIALPGVPSGSSVARSSSSRSHANESGERSPRTATAHNGRERGPGRRSTAAPASPSTPQGRARSTKGSTERRRPNTSSQAKANSALRMLRVDQSIFFIAGMILAAVMLIAGIGYSLHAMTEVESPSRTAQPEAATSGLE